MYYFYNNGGNFEKVVDSVVNHKSNTYCYRTCSLITGLKYFCKGSLLFKYTDIYLKYYTYDERINCDVYLLTVCRVGNEDYCKKYGIPQAIGFCAIDTREV